METVNKPRRSGSSPWVTYGMMALCILLYLLDTVSGWRNSRAFGYAAYGWPSILGMKDNASILAGQYWRLLTANFLHSGLQHIVFNMFSLYMWGRFVEGIYGHGRTVAIILGAALATTCVSFACSANRSLGASGVAFGMMGALLAFSKFNRPLYNRFFGGGMTAMVVVNLLYGFFAASVDGFGHLGGLLGGYLMARIVGLLARREFSGANVLALAGYAALVAGGFLLGLYRWG